MADKVLFLDVDGVLNNAPVFRDRRLGHLPIDNLCVERMHDVIRATGAQIVLSSSWREIDWHELKLQASFVFEMYEGIGSDRLWIRHDDRSTKRLSGPRGNEIAEWLSRHPEVTSYAIVDDDGDMLDEQKPYFVQTHFDDGLTDDLAKQLIAILGAKDATLAA
jgi:hypothetical protein